MARERIYDYPVTEFARAVEHLGWSQVGAARTLGIDPRTARRYHSGDLALNGPLLMLLRVAVHFGLKESDFDASEEPATVLIRAIFRHKISENRFFELASRPIK